MRSSSYARRSSSICAAFVQRRRREIDEADRELEAFGVDARGASKQEDERAEQAAAARERTNVGTRKLSAASAPNALAELRADRLRVRAKFVHRGRHALHRRDPRDAVVVDTEDERRVRARKLHRCVDEKRENLLLRRAISDKLTETEQNTRSAVLHGAR